MTRLESWYGTPVPYGLSPEELRRRLQQPGPSAWAAMVALAAVPGERAVEILSECVASADWTFRRMAIESISNHQLACTVANLIVGALRDPSPYVVRTACAAVVKLGLSEAHHDLVSLLSAAEAATRQVAVRAISDFWRADDFRQVFRLFLSDPSQQVRRDAAWTLYETAEATTWRELFDAWKRDELPRCRVWACHLAGRYGGECVKIELQALATDVDGHVRKAARAVLEKMCHE